MRRSTQNSRRKLGFCIFLVRLKHFQWVAMVSSVNLLLENLEQSSIDVVLSFPPRGPALLVLQPPMAREYWRQHLKAITGNKHFVNLRRFIWLAIEGVVGKVSADCGANLSISSESVSDESLIVRRHNIRRHVERLV